MSGLAVQKTNVAQAVRVTRDGREWLVAPVVALVPGVLNGELVLAEEIGRYTASWDDSPVTVGHPHDGHQYISARSLEALESFACGRLYDVRFEDGRLKGNVWIDLERLGEFGDVGDMILSQISEATGCEVSTGYFRDVEQAVGSSGGRRYESIARNIRPDHLALLPTAEGACNWADGCGVPRTNLQQETSMTKPTASSAPQANASAAQRVLAALAELFGITSQADEIAPEAEVDEIAPEVNEADAEATVALFLSDASAAALALSAGDLPPGSVVLEASGLNVPLLSYDGEDALQFLAGELAYIARSTAVMAAEVTGIGRLITGGAMDVLYLTLGGQAIQRWAYDIGEYLEYWAYGGEEEEEDAPEVDVLPLRLILAYLPAGEATPTIIPATRVTFSHLGVTVGQDQIVFSLAGEMRTAPADPLAEEAVNEASPDAEASEARMLTYADLAGMLAVARAAHPVPASAPDEAAPPTGPDPEPEPVPAAAEAASEAADQAAIIPTPGEGVLAENGDEDMNDRRQLIEALLANENCQCERAVLEAMTLDDLKVMAADMGITEIGTVVEMPALDAPASNGTVPPVTAPAAAEAPTAAPVVESPVAAPVAAVAGNESEIAELLAAVRGIGGVSNLVAAVNGAQASAQATEQAELLTAIREFGGVGNLIAALHGVQANANAERAGLIASLSANHRCAFSGEQLAAFSTEQLRLLEESLEPTDFSVRPRPNGRVASGNSMIVEIPMPAL